MRRSGILMPIFSLPSRYGIGTLGREAYRFVDFLEKSGQSYWQMLPASPTGFGDSPYQSFSVFAGNPYFIDLDMLCEDGWLSKAELEAIDWGKNSSIVDYGLLYEKRFPVLRLAAERFKQKRSIEYDVFCRFHSRWLRDYARFMAVKDSLNGCSVNCWDMALRLRRPEALADIDTRLKSSIEFYQILQFWFYKQWKQLRTYANGKGIKLIGDMPIYTSADSADVWAAPELFELDNALNPKAAAGVPPDAFSKSGQLWGNPLYNWEAMKSNGYQWWEARLRHSLTLFDTVRIDHFRAFSAYFSIPAAAESAAQGSWITGPGIDFFDKMKSALGELPLIAEDLGDLDDDVRRLLKETGFPGMKVLQFAFSPDTESSYLPHNISKDCVVYTGTHDNETAIGFERDGAPEQVKYAKEYLNIAEGESFNWAIIKAAMATSADTVILQMQDFLGLDNSARINTPSVAKGNWCWRIEYSCINDWLAKIIRDTTAVYWRLPRDTEQTPIKH